MLASKAPPSGWLRVAILWACVVGGVDMASQAIALARSPHVVVATPGRLLDHLQNTKGFHLRQLKYLVLDEADRMLSMDFEREINEILEVILVLDTKVPFKLLNTTLHFFKIIHIDV